LEYDSKMRVIFLKYSAFFSLDSGILSAGGVLKSVSVKWGRAGRWCE